MIDEEVRRIIDVCYEKAHTILEENRDILEAMKDALMEYETIDAEQVDDLMARRKVRPPRDWHDGSNLGGKSGADKDKEREKEGSPQKPTVGGPAKEH